MGGVRKWGKAELRNHKTPNKTTNPTTNTKTNPTAKDKETGGQLQTLIHDWF